MSEKGLPVGLEEIYMIERTRANHKLELEVPPGNEKNKWQLRLAIMEANELCHWILREKEIEEWVQDCLSHLNKMYRY